VKKNLEVRSRIKSEEEPIHLDRDTEAAKRDLGFLSLDTVFTLIKVRLLSFDRVQVI